jgi:hypothetical protein
MVLKYILIVVVACILVYILGRILAMAGIHEFESYLNRKFKNKKENGKEEN